MFDIIKSKWYVCVIGIWCIANIHAMKDSFDAQTSFESNDSRPVIRNRVSDDDTARIVHQLLRALSIDQEFASAMTYFSCHVQSFFIHDILQRLTIHDGELVPRDMKINVLMEHHPEQMCVIMCACAKAIFFDAMRSLHIKKSETIDEWDMQRLRCWFYPYSNNFKRVYLNWVHFILYKRPLFYDESEIHFFENVLRECEWIKTRKPKEEIIQFDGTTINFMNPELPEVSVGNKLELFELMVLIFSTGIDTIIVASNGAVLKNLSPFCRSLSIKRNMVFLYGCCLNSYIVLIPVIGFAIARWADLL